MPDRSPPTSPVGDRVATDWIDRALDEAIVRCDHAGRIVAVRGRAELIGVDVDVPIGRRWADLEHVPGPARAAWSTALERCIDTQRPQIAAFRLDHGDGARAFEARMLPEPDGGAVVAVRDVGERDLLRERVEYLALHDAVTGLGNVRTLRERLAAWLARGEDGGGSAVALLVVDLDRFKQTNDLHGRSIGDSLLKLVAQRLHRESLNHAEGLRYDARDVALPSPRTGAYVDPAVADDVVVVRIGGDQFAVAWRIDESRQGRPAADLATALATRLVAALSAPTRIAGQTLFVRASIGIAIAPVDARDASSLYSHAEAALMRAKRAGRNDFRRHGDEATTRAPALPPTSEASIRDALAAGEFLLVWQPKFELASSLSAAHARGSPTPGAVIAVEALCRWRTPNGALLIPQDFLPLAEASGVIRPLGDWVLRQALAEVARFPAGGAAAVGVSVNVSLSQLRDRAFVETVRAALADVGFAPQRLTLEIAETAFLEDIRLVADVVAELSSSGVRLAVDHFGIGTAGLVALKSLPVDEIKIDRSFIAGAAIDAFDATIVAGLIGMAHDLGKTVTAEGVERVEQIAALATMRCDAIQGYFIGEPMTADELVATASLWKRTRDGRGTG